MEAFYRTCHRVSQQILQQLAQALDLPASNFAEPCRKDKASTMSISHSLEVHVREVDAGQTCRIGPHFDFTLISLAPSCSCCARSAPRCASTSASSSSAGATAASARACTASPSRTAAPELVRDEMLPERFSVAFSVKAIHDASVGFIARFVTPEFPQAYEHITAAEAPHRRNKVTYNALEQTAAVEAVA
ncbi:hypothetical protein B0J12DRAFT_775853 [Macrophomina phaseolina]|uniref:Uncharacterized protein n=1 Tax=Macrophomina phaseolina TaxID=35725 RepID=A0ABQ8GGU0_9PEZI|nr:hypothetical protein B0J12DRAFT_775853 [Macrophomina phaseolina]